MKKLFFTMLTVAFCATTFGQESRFIPQEFDDLYTPVGGGAKITFNNSSVAAYRLINDTSQSFSGTLNFSYLTPFGPPTGANIMSFYGTSVGLGVTLPVAKLHVKGTTYMDGSLGIGESSPTAKLHVNGNSYFDGFVGIGSKNPDAELTVNGKIHAEEVKVDLLVPADYVFEKYYTGISQLKEDYVLLSLEAVEEFTKENHHLPGVSSAKEIQENGLQLGEMSNLLLQKIEELTLYTIEQEKRIKALEDQLNDQD